MKNTLFSLLILVVACQAAAASRPDKPNIVLLLIDDLGWQDVKCYDVDAPSPVETPNIDRLASKGVQFWQGYSPSPVCAPSRAAILSGEHPARIEMTHVAGGSPPHAWHPNQATISPWYSVRMPVETYTLAEALKAEGYVTGHSGKWHISQNHYAYPNAYHHGFDHSTHHRGVQVPMTPDRLTGFASKDPKDPYRLDENGFPYDEPQQGAMSFLKDNKDQPFFLYYATWLVHAPIVMRSEALLRKYEKKLGVTLTDEHKEKWTQPGQTNPFYCAMVEQLDYYMGQVFEYLETTDDPRWPGHKLVENTYIIFTSDNGGMEGGGGAVYTDNFPLDRGKISLKEGGVRVPLIMTGPGIPAGVETDVMANGLDFYPTILSLVGAQKPADKQLDGCDLVPLLTKNPQDPTLVRDANGKVRNAMAWHFPQAEKTSSIRKGDYKLVRRYRNEGTSLELYRLYKDEGGRAVRVDIEEMQNVLDANPELAAALDAQLSEIVTGMGGRTPYLNPKSSHGFANKDKVPTVLDCKQSDRTVVVSYQENGAKVVHADIIYAVKGGETEEEWLRLSAIQKGNGRAVAELPAAATHYFVNLIDENNFLVCYPEIDRKKKRKNQRSYSEYALAAGYPKMKAGKAVDLVGRFKRLVTPGEGSVLIRESFESQENLSLKTEAPGISVTTERAVSGKHSLLLHDVEGLSRDWMPIVDKSFTIPDACAGGQFRLSCDIMLDPNSPGELRIIMRDHNSRESRVELDSIFIGDGAFKVQGQALVEIKPGTWYHIEIASDLGETGEPSLTVLAATADGRRRKAVLPRASRSFHRPDWIGFSGMGEPGSRVYLDNIVLRADP